MKTHAKKTQAHNNQSVAKAISQEQRPSGATFRFEDNRAQVVAQREIQKMADNSPRMVQLKKLQEIANNKTQREPTAQMQVLANGYSSQQHGFNSNIIQLNAAADLAAAQQNQVYLVAETGNLSTAGNNVRAAINGAPNNAIRDSAAEGLRYYWQTMIDGFDGKKAEMYEAEMLAAGPGGHIPILSTNDLTDPDVRTETGGNVVATEVKAINSNNTGNVNTLIQGADRQLGNRLANVKKIKIRIESNANLWPDARYNNINRIGNNTDLKNWLTQPGVIPALENAHEIQIEGINVPYGAANGKRNFWAEVKGTGDIKKTGAQVW